MVGSNRVFLLLLACFLLLHGIAGAQGWPIYLIEVDLEGMDDNALRLLERQSSEHFKLAGRTATTAFLHASGADLENLTRLAIGFDLITEASPDLEYYIVKKELGVEDALEWSQAKVLMDRPAYYLVSVRPSDAFSIHQLPSKRRLRPADAPASALRFPGKVVAEAPPATFTYSPAVQTMVDSVSEARLYSMMRELSGETSVVVEGQTRTIYTRYSPTELCTVAAYYLRDRFEALGLSTEFQFYNFRRTLKSIYFPAGNLKGWAVGREGLIIHTDDGGQVWSPQDSGLDIALNDVVMVDDYGGCTAGNSGEILWTADGGANWNNASDPTGADLNKLHFTDANTGYCCGAGGVVLKSTDGGATWSSLSSGTSKDLNGIVFVNSTDGWAVGADGRIIRTTNGGTSWSNVSSPTSDDLMDVTFAGETDGWIATAAGRVLKTEDGEVWQEVVTPVSGALRSLCFASDGLTGWACGPDGAIIKTYDGGDSWTDLSLPYAAALWDIYFLDVNEGWYCGVGYLHHTVDGGSDWQSQVDNVLLGDINVIATLPGTVKPEEIYIICGHYDSTSNSPYYSAPGADDNGTGTLAVVEAARALREHEFESTIRFVCFSREEQGLIGSLFYAGMISARGDSVAGALNFDMIGYVDQQPEEVDIIYDDNSFGLADAFRQSASLYVPTLGCRITYGPNTRWSDHASFWDQGYPAFCGIEDSPLHNPYYHRTTDRVNTLDFDFYGDVVRAAIATLAELARIDSTSAGVPGAVAATRIEVLPNPCVGGAKIELAGRVGPEAELEFYDVRGRLVSRVRPDVRGGGATAVWNAAGEGGQPLSPGIYFVKVAGALESKKIILLK
jgi:photosystem II stability/assembly factor-like uncharacterized protein